MPCIALVVAIMLCITVYGLCRAAGMASREEERREEVHEWKDTKKHSWPDS